MRYVNFSTNFKSLSLKVEVAPSRFKLLNPVFFFFFLRSHGSYYLLLLAPDYVVGV